MRIIGVVTFLRVFIVIETVIPSLITLFYVNFPSVQEVDTMLWVYQNWSWPLCLIVGYALIDMSIK